MFLTYREIARNLNVDAATVCRVAKLFEETGTVNKRSHPHGYDHHLKQLTKCDEYFIAELVVEKPGIYLRELQPEVHKLTGTISQLLLFVISCMKIDSHIVSCLELHVRGVIY